MTIRYTKRDGTFSDVGGASQRKFRFTRRNGTYINVTPTISQNAIRFTLRNGAYFDVSLPAAIDGLWAWGMSFYGELGLGATQSSAVLPTRVGSDNNWVSIAAGWDYSVAIKSDGSLWAWGFNNNGHLGLGSAQINKNIPTRVGSDNNWKSVSAGYFGTLAIKTDGSLWGWGNNENYILGLGDIGNPIYTPTRVGTDNNWKSVVTGYYNTLAIKTDGSLWGWGNNQYEQLVQGDTTPRDTPVRIGTDNNWASVSVCDGQSFVGVMLAIKTDGSLWVWGNNQSGTLGFNDYVNRSTPTRVGSDNDWASVSAGWGHSVAIKTNGQLWAWGENHNGQLGLGDIGPRRVPTRVGVNSNWAKVTAKFFQTLAIRTDGSLWAWGYGNYGVLGLVGDFADKTTPTHVGTDNNWGSVVSGQYHALGIRI